MIRVACDLDGVLFDFSQGFGAFLKRRYGITPDWSRGYDLALQDPPGEAGITYMAFNEFCHLGCMQSLPNMAGATPAKAQELAKNVELYLLTSRPLSVQDDTYQALRRFGIMEHVHSSVIWFTQSRTKAHICNDLRIKVLIEDGQSEVERCIAAGIEVYVPQRPYNTEWIQARHAGVDAIPYLHVVANFDEAAQELIEQAREPKRCVTLVPAPTVERSEIRGEYGHKCTADDPCDASYANACRKSGYRGGSEHGPCSCPCHKEIRHGDA